MPQIDFSRVYDGFMELSQGMNGGISPSLISNNQVAFCRDMTFRGGFATTRPAFKNHIFQFADSVTKSNMVGKFQGACWYDAQFGNSGFVFSVGGRLFRLQLGRDNSGGENVISEITPHVYMVTTSDFDLPLVGSTVSVGVTDIANFSVGQTIYINGGEFTVISMGADSLLLEYVGGSALTVSAGSIVYNDNFDPEPANANPTGISIKADFTVPALNGTVNATVNNSNGLALQDIYVFGGHYQIQKDGITGNVLTVEFLGSSNFYPTGYPTTAPLGTIVYDSSGAIQITQTTAQFTVPAVVGSTVSVALQSVASLSFGETVFIQSAQYLIMGSGTISSPVTMELIAQPVKVPSGTKIYDFNNVLVNTTTEADFTIPAINAQSDLYVVNANAFGLFQLLINYGKYIVTAIVADTVTLKFYGINNPSGLNVYDDTQNLIYEYQTNPDTFDFVDIRQAENYVLVFAAPHPTTIYDGTSARLAGVKTAGQWGANEIPPAVMGIYLWGRIWVCLQNRKTYQGGDIIYGSSGTPSLGMVDAILKFTENTTPFSVPNNAGPITAMQSLATQDTSLGVGNLLIGTTNMVFSCNAPPDSTTWASLTYPIQTISLIDYGPIGPRSNASIRGDWWYRSIDGIRSFQVCRRNFGVPGNAPLSREVSQFLNKDDQNLLFYGSNIMFNNRMIQTVAPLRTAYGVIHQGLVVDNFDLISGQSGNSSAAWEGAYSGLQVFQVLKGIVNGVERGFAFALNASNELELWEFLKDDEAFDDKWYSQDDDGNTVINTTPIQPQMETRSMNFLGPEELKQLSTTDVQGSSQLKELETCELFIDEISGNVSLSIFYRPDQYPDWLKWETVSINPESSCQTLSAGSCQVWKEARKTYASRILLTQPPECSNPLSGMLTRLGYEFQFRIEGSGHFRIRKFKPHAKTRQDSMAGDYNQLTQNQPIVSTCEKPIWDYSSQGT
jgi:hypothetical protein